MHLFGDTVTAKIAIVADTKWVDPARLRVTTNFAPYTPIEAAAQCCGSASAASSR